jgi:hypothetical protein
MRTVLASSDRAMPRAIGRSLTRMATPGRGGVLSHFAEGASGVDGECGGRGRAHGRVLRDGRSCRAGGGDADQR